MDRQCVCSKHHDRALPGMGGRFDHNLSRDKMLSPDERAGTRPSRAKAAESLIRSLVGVADARVGNGNGRIDNIRIVPRGNASPHQITRNVASAIMAHFGQSIDPATITVQAQMAETETYGRDLQDQPVTAAPNDRPLNGHAAANGSADHSPNGSDSHDPMTRPHDDVGNGQRADAIRFHADAPAALHLQAPPAAPAATAQPVSQPSTPSFAPPAQPARTVSNGHPQAQTAPARVSSTATAQPAASAPARVAPAAPAYTAPVSTPAATVAMTNGNGHHASPRVRLESVEISNVERGLRCRVALSLAGETYTGVGDGPDRPADLTDLAARVTIDALRAARCPRQPMQLEGTATTVVAGQSHVVTAVAIWNGTDFDRVSGAQPVAGSPAEAAALSVIRSVAERMQPNA